MVIISAARLMNLIGGKTDLVVVEGFISAI